MSSDGKPEGQLSGFNYKGCSEGLNELLMARSIKTPTDGFTPNIEASFEGIRIRNKSIS